MALSQEAAWRSRVLRACVCAEMLEIVWRVSYAIITAVLAGLLLWRIFGLKENPHFKQRSQGAPRLRQASRGVQLSARVLL